MRSHLTCGGDDLRGSAASSAMASPQLEGPAAAAARRPVSRRQSRAGPARGAVAARPVRCVACRTLRLPRLGPAPSRSRRRPLPRRWRTFVRGCARRAGRTRPKSPAGRSGPTWATSVSWSPTGRTGSTGRRRRRRWPAPPLPGRARRRGDPLRARPGRRAGRACAAAGPVPRLAGLVLALREGHPAPGRPRRARRRPRRRVQRGRAGHAGLRVLRPPGRPAAGSIAVAGLWAGLMGVLGYPRFGAAGGDLAAT